MSSVESGLTRQIAMRDRTRKFALETVRLCGIFPSTVPGRHVAGQLIRGSTSVAANYRAACRAQSRRTFIAKIGIVLEEIDETYFWLGVAKDLDLISGDKFETILSEAGQLVAIFTATRSTARKRLNQSKKPIG